MKLARLLKHFWWWWNFPRRHRIPQDALVLDVGCGNWPNMRANILSDKFLLDNSERVNALTLDSRPFVVCDAVCLPFKDNSVDYVICSHLAEHLEEPERLFSELSRVANAGYIETPSRIREILHSGDGHLWYVEVNGDQLTVEEKPHPVHDPHLNAWFDHWFATGREFERFFLDNMRRLGMFAAYDWVGDIKYHVQRSQESTWRRRSAQLENIGRLSHEDMAGQLERMPVARLTTNERIKSTLSAFARRRSDRLAKKRLGSILCCPVCRGDLATLDNGDLFCVGCDAQFPVVGQVYYLVPEQVPKQCAQPSAQHD